MFKYPLRWWLLLFSFTFSKQHAKVWITYFCFIIIIIIDTLLFLSFYSPQGKNMFWLKTNFKSNFQKTWLWTGVTVAWAPIWGEKLIRHPPDFTSTCRDVRLAQFQWCVLVLKRTTPGQKVQVPDVCRVLHKHGLEVTGRVQRTRYRKYRTVSNTHYGFHSWVSTQRPKDPKWHETEMMMWPCICIFMKMPSSALWFD